MPMTPKQMIKLLEDNGFVEVRQNGSHKFFVNAQTNRRTTVPYHNKELPKGIEQVILKQAGIK
ncbi:MAG: putative phage protein [Lachnospiraceae bacterium]|jgi:predicted RNA binding protein YcfA (HicA-like mRNA interferase family)|nr:putative phage protein [Lachnospiraceae bacterium]